VHTELEPDRTVGVYNNISGRKIGQAVELGLTSMTDLRQQLGVDTRRSPDPGANALLTVRLKTPCIASHNRSAYATARRRPW
jgi:hypothetical protein